MEVQEIPGNKRGSKYFTCEATRGFYYRKKAQRNNVTYLVCVQNDCKARASFSGNLFVSVQNELHNHLPDPAKKEALMLKQRMLTEAASTSDEIKTIFVANSARANADAAAKLAFPSMSKAMRRCRRFNQPAMPTSLQNYGTICEGNLRFGKIDGKAFCRGAVGEGDFLSVLFLAEELEDLFAEATEIHLDGTFKTRPRKPSSSQLLTILVVRYGIAFPGAFALMTSRRVEAYNAVLSKIKAIVPAFKPHLIMTDFEAALVRSLGENFPNARKTGCWFHYCQAVMKQAGSLQMKPLLKNNVSARKAVKMTLCLPLLPPENIVEGLHYISSFLRQKHLEEDFENLIRYHERQWLGRVGGDSLSVFKRTRRTNNDCESFHAALVRILRVRGPNVWEFTDGLRNITALTVRELKAFVNEGLQIRVLGKRKFRYHNRRIQAATAQFLESNNVGSFLDMVCQSVEALLERDLTDVPLEVNLQEQEQAELLAPLDGDVPAEYETPAQDGNDEHSGDEESNPVGAVALVPYPQLGLDYDFADEDAFHLPEDEYEQIPLEAFENGEEEDQPQIPNPFRGSGYDDDIDETLPAEEACSICTCRKKNYALVNCGHLLCGYCATHCYNPLDVPSNKCPICTTIIIREPLKIFF